MRHKFDSSVLLETLHNINKFLIGIHSVFFLFFAITQVWLMMIVNIFSVTVYAIGFPLLKKQKITVYTLVAFVEILIHMFLTVISLGWGYGFQLYFIACIAVVFYADYFAVQLKGHHIPGILLSVICCLLYFVSLFYIHENAPLYEINEGVEYAVLILNSLVVFTFCTIFYKTLTSSANANEEDLTELATHDKLTGLANRAYLLERLQQIYQRGRLDDYWLAILDIDDFKAINDTYGHNCGDYILKGVAKLVQGTGKELTVCRWGGEEFVLVGHIPKESDEETESEAVILERIRLAVAAREFIYGGNRVKLTITIGVSRYMESQTIEDWIDTADQKLYVGKHSGKNRLVQ